MTKEACDVCADMCCGQDSLLAKELARVRELLRPHCPHVDLYDGHLCLDCGFDHGSVPNGNGGGNA